MLSVADTRTLKVLSFFSWFWYEFVYLLTNYFLLLFSHSLQFSSVAQSCPTLCDPMDHSMPGLLVHHQLSELPKLISIESVMPFNHLILCRPLLLLPSIFPSIRVFSNESALCIRWPKYWSFSFNISPSNEHSGLISLRMDWLDLLAVQWTLGVINMEAAIKEVFFSLFCFVLG